VPPGRHLSCTRLLHCFFGVALVFPRVRFSVLRVEHSSHECTSRVVHYAISWPRSGPASFGLHATPEFIATQSVLIAYLSRTRTPTFSASSGGFVGRSQQSHLCLVFSARLRSPPSFRSREHPFRVGPFSVSWLLHHHLVLRS